VDPETEHVAVRAEAGTDGYLDDITVSVDPSDERSTGPTGRALNTGEIQTVQDVESSDQHDPWRDAVDQHGFNASAAIPLIHEGTVYGVLNVYTERADAFGERERTVVGQLGEIVGHAIAAAERKQALVSDELVELGIRIEDLFGPTEAEGKIVIDHTVRTGDGEFLIYGTATEDAVDSIGPLVQDRPEWTEVKFYSDEEPRRFELTANESPILSTLASLGGYIDHATIEEGDLRMTIHFTLDVDIRDAVDRIKEAYPQAEMLRRRQISRSSDDFDRSLMAELTDRQRTTLEAAYAAGFFQWPRDASGEDVAASMGVSPPTFHQHLRKAERKVFESLFSTTGRGSE
jgi:predicted DNA binding protein